MGGEARWRRSEWDMKADARADWERRREQDMEQSWDEAQRLLACPENAWAAQAIGLYLDCKDHLTGLRPKDLTPWGLACFRAIRYGSGGLLGNPPLL